MSIGELTAISWLAESWRQHDALKAFPDRVIAVDFDDFLADVSEGTRNILRHFGLQSAPGLLTGLMRSPVLTRYSKAPEYAYTPHTRAELIDASRRTNREEICKGMVWLDRIAQSTTPPPRS
jgi:hypothetical protein